jgi:hypothetical protein
MAKKRQTFGKIQRERERAEKRARKQEKKDERKAAALAEAEGTAGDELGTEGADEPDESRPVAIPSEDVEEGR